MSCNLSESPWSPEDDAVVREHYPEGGSRAVLAILPARTKHAVQKRASILRVPNRRKTRAVSEVEEMPWPTPAHDYCEADIALRQWRAAMPVVGIFAPSLGLVMGEAA